MMRVTLTPSPSITHKYRVILPNRRAIDFGQKGVQHYPDHGNARLMRAHLIRKGAIIPKKLRIETNLHEIHRGMLSVEESEDVFKLLCHGVLFSFAGFGFDLAVA